VDFFFVVFAADDLDVVAVAPADVATDGPVVDVTASGATVEAVSALEPAWTVVDVVAVAPVDFLPPPPQAAASIPSASIATPPRRQNDASLMVQPPRDRAVVAR
jgi:hypothetical protein